MGGIFDKALTEQTGEEIVNSLPSASVFKDHWETQSMSSCLMAVFCAVDAGGWQKVQEEVICKLFQLVASRYSLVIIILNSHYLLHDKEHWHQDCRAELNITELYCNQRAANVCVPDIFTRCCELRSRGSVLSSPNTVFLNYQHARTSCIADWNLSK